MHTQAIVFDFDGVIVEESESVVKERAWDSVAEAFGFGETGRKARLAAQTRYAKGRGTRFDILRDTFSVLGTPADQLEPKVKQAAERFNAFVQDGIVALGIAPRDRRALEELAARLPLFINSATPEPAMQETVARLEVASLFRGVYGMPSNKLDNLERARLAVGASAPDICYVGDGSHDAEAARAFGCAFIGRANGHNGWQPPMPFPLIRSLDELIPLIG